MTEPTRYRVNETPNVLDLILSSEEGMVQDLAYNPPLVKDIFLNMFNACAARFFKNFLMHFCPGTMTTHVESMNSDIQRGPDRRLRYTQH